MQENKDQQPISETIDSHKTRDFDAIALAAVEKFQDRRFGYLVRYLYSALSSFNAQVPEIVGLNQLDKHMVFSVPNISVDITRASLPYDFKHGGEWTDSPNTEEYYDKAIQAESPPTDYFSEMKISLLQNRKERDQAQLHTFTEHELAELNSIFLTPLRELRDFQVAFLCEIISQVPGLEIFRLAIHLIISQALAGGKIKRQSAPPHPYQIRNAAVSKTYELSTPIPDLANEYETMIHRTSLGIELFLEREIKKTSNDVDNESLANCLENYLDDLIKTAIIALLPLSQLRLLTQEQSHLILSGKRNLDEFIAVPLLESVKTSIRYSGSGEPFICLTDESNQILRLVNTTRLKVGVALDEVTQYTLENLLQEMIGYVNQPDNTATKNVLTTQTLKNVYTMLAVAKCADVLKNIILKLRDKKISTSLALLQATKIAVQYRGDWEHVFEPYLLPTRLTASNIGQIVKEATGWSIVKNGSAFFNQRADQLGYKVDPIPLANIFNALGADSFSLFDKGLNTLKNSSKEEIAELSTKKIFTLESRQSEESQFIEMRTFTRDRTEHVEFQQHPIKNATGPDFRLTNTDPLITSGHDIMNLPVVEGCMPNRIVLNLDGKEETIDHYMTTTNGGYYFQIPDFARNKTNLFLFIDYVKVLDTTENTVFLNKEQRLQLRNLTQELSNKGFWRIAEAFQTLLQTNHSISIHTIVEVIQSCSAYSHNLQSISLDEEHILDSLSTFLDKDSGLYMCQCDSANELLMYCLNKIFSATDSIRIYSVSGFQTDPLNVSPSVTVNLSQAHRKLKVVVSDIEFSVDATPPMKAEASDSLSKKEKNDNVREAANNAKKKLLETISEKSKKNEKLEDIFRDRLAPIPHLIDVLNQIVTSGKIDSQLLLEYIKSLDKHVLIKLSDDQAARFGLNYLAGNLDIYIKLKKTAQEMLTLNSTM